MKKTSLKNDKSLKEQIEKKVEELWLESKNKEISTPLEKETWLRIKKSTKKHQRYLYAKIAAVFVGLIGIVGLLMQTDNSQPIQITNNGTTPKHLNLDDGSSVILNRNSSLSYHPEISRTVSITGEAYFDIKKDSLNPFKVHTSAVTVKVYGTSFNVYSFPKDQTTQVSLYSGKVQLENTAGKLTKIIPGQTYSYNHTTHQETIKDHNIQKQIDWTHSKIICHEISMNKLLKKIANYYAITFQVEDSEINKKLVSGSFRVDKDVEDFLEMIKFSHNISYKKLNEHTYLLKINP